MLGFSLPVTGFSVRLEDFASLGIPLPCKSEFTVCLAQPRDKKVENISPLLASPAQPKAQPVTAP